MTWIDKPRKLKKAARHCYIVTMECVATAQTYAGYPRTKWVRRVEKFHQRIENAYKKDQELFGHYANIWNQITKEDNGND